MSTDFEWTRIALAMGLMTFCFLVLPVFFLWRDNHAGEPEADTLRDTAVSVRDDEAVGVGPDRRAQR